MSHRRLRIKRNARVQCLSAFYAFSVKFSVSEFFDTGSNLENYCYKSRRKIRIKRKPWVHRAWNRNILCNNNNNTFNTTLSKRKMLQRYGQNSQETWRTMHKTKCAGTMLEWRTWTCAASYQHRLRSTQCPWHRLSMLEVMSNRCSHIATLAEHRTTLKHVRCKRYIKVPHVRFKADIHLRACCCPYA